MGMFGDLLGTVLGGVEKPKVPTFKPINVQTEGAKAIAANLENLPAAENLASQYNLFNTEQIQKMLEQAIPGYASLTGKVTSVIGSEVAGQIPKDVSAQVQLSDAAKALAGGYSGAGMHGNLVARDLGLTSLDLTQRGLSAAESWISTMDRLFAPGQFNLSSMFITPQFQTQVDIQQQESQWGVNWLKNQIAAMADPTMEAVGQAVGGIADMALNYVSFGASGLGGGMQSKGSTSNALAGSGLSGLQGLEASGGGGMMSLFGG